MFSLKSSGSFDKTTRFLEYMKTERAFQILNRHGQEGVNLLSSATPYDTGETAQSWEYEVRHQNGSHVLAFYNNNVEGGVNVAVILQYGHGTGTGGYVEGLDYINPALRPLFDRIVEEIWREVANA